MVPPIAQELVHDRKGSEECRPGCYANPQKVVGPEFPLQRREKHQYPERLACCYQTQEEGYLLRGEAKPAVLDGSEQEQRQNCVSILELGTKGPHSFVSRLTSCVRKCQEHGVSENVKHYWYAW
jgi:hypothetical protein